MAYLERTSETMGHGPVAARSAREVAEAPQVRTQRHDQHHVIFYEGDAAERIYELQDGIVMLYKLLPDGRRQVVEILTRGMIFGTAGGPRYDVSAETLTPVRLAVHERREVDASAVLQSHVAKCLMAQMEGLHEHAMLLGRKSAMERVASYFMRMVPNRGGEGCSGPASDDCDPHNLVLNMTRQEIADYLGLTIETVSRVISELKRRGVIRLERQDRIHVTRVCGLCQLTGIH